MEKERDTEMRSEGVAADGAARTQDTSRTASPLEPGGAEAPQRKCRVAETPLPNAFGVPSLSGT